MMILPTSALPVKAILSTSRCATSGAPALAPSPVTMLTTPGGSPASAKSSASSRSGERRLLGGLEHHRAAGGDRRRELPGRHEQRIVPRDDLAGDADRLAQREAHRVVGHGQHLAVDLGGEAAVVLEAGGDVGDVVLGLDDRLAGVASSRARRARAARSRTIRASRNRMRPRSCAVDVLPGPFVERPARRGDRAVDVGGVGIRHAGDHLCRSPDR